MTVQQWGDGLGDRYLFGKTTNMKSSQFIRAGRPHMVVVMNTLQVTHLTHEDMQITL